MSSYRKTAFFAASESSYNDGTTPSASDFISTLEAKMELEQEPNDSKELSPSLAKKPPGAANKQVYKISLQYYLKGSGTNTGSVTDPPAFHPLWLAGSLALTGAVYSPDSESDGSVVCDLYRDGKRRRATGCRFNYPQFEVQDDGKVIVTQEGYGLYTAEVDATTPTVADNEAPPIIGNKACAASWGPISTSEMKATVWSFKPGGKAEMIPGLNATTGIERIDNTVEGREPVIGLDPEDILVADADLQGYFTGGTTGAFSLLAGQNADNRFTFAAPAAYISKLADAERSGLNTYDLELTAVSSNDSDNDFTITMS